MEVPTPEIKEEVKPVLEEPKEEPKVTEEETKFDVSFDLVITVDNCSYRANVTMQMPCGNIIEEGTCSIEKTDFSDLVFKRE